MATRRDAREWAVQILFEMDFNPKGLESVLAEFWREHEADPAARGFAEELVRGVRRHLDEIDARIRTYAANWDLARMAAVDRNAIRMALFEMLYRDDIPPVVSINEAIDIAKYFSSFESGRFVNGILDRARKEIPRAARTAASPEGSGAQA